LGAKKGLHLQPLIRKGIGEVHKNTAEEIFINKKSNFIWWLKNKVLHLHPLRDRRKVHQEILE